MTHVRTLLRRRAKALLDGIATVFVGRTWPTGQEVLPCLLVYTLDEPSLDSAMGGMGMPVRQERRVTLKVEGRATGTEDEALLDTLDEMARQVEVKFLTAGALDGLALAIALAQTLTRTSATTDARHGEVEMTFIVEYHTAAGAPDVAL